MRIEVLVGSEEPRIYPLKKNQLLLGSLEAADVVINANGISRKHLLISVEGDSYYVTDQGSSNGSFINEERLVPGRKTSFTSFFPVRLGAEVLVSLLSDEDAHDLGFLDDVGVPKKETTNPKIKLNEVVSNDSTRVISLKDLREAKTENLVRRRQEGISRRKEVAKKPASTKRIKPKENSRTKLIQFLALVLVGSAVYYNFFYVDEHAPVAEIQRPIAKVGELMEVPSVAEVAPKEFELVPQNELSVKESFGSLLQDFRCTIDVEKYLCEKIGLTDPWGVVLVGTSLDVLVDGTSYFEGAKNLLEKRAGFVAPTLVEEREKFEASLRALTLALFIQQRFPSDVDYEKFSGYKINLAFFTMDKSSPGPMIYFVASFVPKTLKLLKDELTLEKVENVKKSGVEALDWSKAYYRMY